MAIAKMEKLALTIRAEHLERVLELMQGFQGVHIETGIESTVPPAKKVEVEKGIREIERDLQEIQAAHSILQGRESANMLTLLKKGGEKYVSIAEMTKIVEESNWEDILSEVIKTDRRLQNSIQRRKEVIRHFDELTLWERLLCNPLDFKRLLRSTAWFGSVHEKHEEKFLETILEHEASGIHIEKVTAIDERAYFFIACHNSVVDALNMLLNVFSFSPEDYPFDKPQGETRKSLEKEERKLLEDEAEISKQIAAQAKYDDLLKFAEDHLLNDLLRKKQSLEVTYFGDDVAINGWILADKCRLFRELLSVSFDSEEYSIVLSTVKSKDLDNVPIKLQNSRLFTVYERLTEMYSMPRYNEIDPTPVMAIFYLIFFGMMVADLGYGFAIFIVGLFIKKGMNVKRSTKSLVDFLFFLSFPVMGWGLVFGSFFGLPLPFSLIDSQIDVIPLIFVSLILGYIHIMAGLVIQMLNQVKLKNYFEMLTGGLAWFSTFFGGGLMILGAVVVNIAAIFWIGAVLLAAGLGMTVVVPAVQYGSRWYLGVGKGLYSLYGATSYLGDFVSYARLMALGIAGGSVALAFNTILGFLPLPARLTLGIVLAVGLHALNMFLTFLSAYVHGIRLQFIEFFGKFYTGGGKRFEPFKAAEKNVIISDAQEDEA